MLEYNPYHTLVICIYLANKTERGKSQHIVNFVMTFMQKVDIKYQDLYQDMLLKWENVSCQIYQLDKHPAQPFDEYAYLKNLEIEICRALNFEFLVHNPLHYIGFMQDALHNYFRENEN